MWHGSDKMLAACWPRAGKTPKTHSLPQITKRSETRKTRRLQKHQKQRVPNNSDSLSKISAANATRMSACTLQNSKSQKHASAIEIESERGPNLFYIATMRRAPHIRLINKHTTGIGQTKTQCKQRWRKSRTFP